MAKSILPTDLAGLRALLVRLEDDFRTFNKAHRSPALREALHARILEVRELVKEKERREAEAERRRLEVERRKAGEGDDSDPAVRRAARLKQRAAASA